MVTIADFINRAIDRGIEGVKESWPGTDERDTARREGSIEGFEACRGKTPTEILDVLANVRRECNEFMQLDDSEQDKIAGGTGLGNHHYWRLRHREVQIEWVANCLSAALVNSGIEPIVPVTARGMMQADRVLKSLD